MGVWRHLVSYQEFQSGTEAQLKCWEAILWENEGTWSVTRNFNLGLKLSLSAERPFSRRMEAPSQLPGISF